MKKRELKNEIKTLQEHIKTLDERYLETRNKIIQGDLQLCEKILKRHGGIITTIKQESISGGIKRITTIELITYHK